MRIVLILDATEQGRRDDLEALGNMLLHLLHGRLPWQGIYAAARRVGEMKAGRALQALLARSPPEFADYFGHVRGLAFGARPDYALLRGAFKSRMEREGWAYDARAFDWMRGGSLEKGTLVPGEYVWDTRFADVDVI